MILEVITKEAQERLEKQINILKQIEILSKQLKEYGFSCEINPI